MDSNSENETETLSLKISATVAVDAVSDMEDVYDGFYETGLQHPPTLISCSPTVSENNCGKIEMLIKAERQKRLVKSIAALQKTMKSVTVTKLNKILNSVIDDEQKRKAEALEERIAEAERKMAGRKRVVEVSMTFLNISDVEAFKETFDAEVMVSLRWRELALDTYTDAELKKLKFEEFFNPNVYIDNILVERRSTIVNNVFRDENGLTFLTERIVLKGLFSFKGTFKTFPFDVQDLGVTLTSDCSSDYIEFKPHQIEINSLHLHPSGQLWQSWYLHEQIDTKLKTLSAEMTGFAHNRPAFEIIARVARSTKFYWYNTYSIIFFITLMASLTFVIDPTNGSSALAARLHLCFMVFLNVISYKITVSLTMPRLSYLTCVDKYSICNLLSLVVLIFYYGLEGRVLALRYSTDDLRIMDRNGMLGCLGCFILWNLVYFIWLEYSVCAKRREARRFDAAHKKLIKRRLAWIIYKNKNSC